MPLSATLETLEHISTLSELSNTFEQAAIAIGVTPDEFGTFLSEHAEARQRWERGGVEAMNQLRVCLTRQALSGSVQAFKCLDEIAEKAASKKIAPLLSTSTPPAKNNAGRAWRFVSVADAAIEVGLTAKTIQNFVREGKTEEATGKPNPVPMKLGRGGEWTVQPGAVYAWAIARIERGLTKRRPKELTEPPGYSDSQNAPSESGGEPQSTALVPLDLDVNAIIEYVLRVQNITNEDKKILIAAAESIRRNTDSEERRLSKISRDDVIKMLRSLLDIYCEAVEASASAKAADLLRVIREVFHIDLSATNTAALQIITSTLCDQANRFEIPAVRQRVRDAVEGVQILEGVA